MAGTLLSCHLLKTIRNLAATWGYRLKYNFLSECVVWSHTVTKERKVGRLEMVSVAGNTTVFYQTLLSPAQTSCSSLGEAAQLLRQEGGEIPGV